MGKLYLLILILNFAALAGGAGWYLAIQYAGACQWPML